jgi:hypothetical protein
MSSADSDSAFFASFPLLEFTGLRKGGEIVVGAHSQQFTTLFLRTLIGFEREGHMSVNNQQDSAVSQMSDLFGEPPLMRGEDSARYWRLHALVTHEFKPKTDFERLYVREYTDKLWQQQRYKKGSASMVEAGYVEALANLLRPFHPQLFMSTVDPATEMARDYYSGEAKTKRIEEVELCMAVHRISQEQILAEAMKLCGNSVQSFSRMETHCENSLRMLRKESDRRSAVEVPKVPGSDEGGGKINLVE